MIFATLPLAEAEGAILAHGVNTGAVRFKKGRTLSADDVAALAAEGIDTVTVARLEPGDVTEDEAARRLAEALQGANTVVTEAFTGRANLYARASGLLHLDADRVHALNALDEALTVATLAPYEVVTPRQMLATVKIMPFAVPEDTVAAAEALARAGAISVAPFQMKRVALISTTLPGLKASLLDKNAEAMRARLNALGNGLAAERRVPHTADAIAAALRELDDIDITLIFAASAIVDRRDVVPAGILAAGGAIERFGMPVDPGNLTLLAHLDGRPVVGLPGCARSPKLNGFDWVLQRLLADVPIASADVALMGVGGLLKEIASRPQPREPRAPHIAAIVLAAGRSSRMGRSNKLVSTLDDKPLVRHAVEAALASQAEPVVVVFGHQAADVRAALNDLHATLVDNPDFADGLSTSLRAGLTALETMALDNGGVDGALVCLGDMPRVTAAHLDRLIAAFNPLEGRAICVPIHNGRRGNPVLWPATLFSEMKMLTGDVGAKALLARHAELVCEVAFDDDAIHADIDTPEALSAFGGAPA